MTPYAQMAQPSEGVNAKPMGLRKYTEETIVQLKFASSQCLDIYSYQDNRNLQNKGFD